MKKLLFIICLFVSSTANAQKNKRSNPDTLNFTAINKLMYPDGKTFKKVKSIDISNTNAGLPYNEKRATLLNNLVNEIDLLNIAILDINDAVSGARIFEYKGHIDYIKKAFPQFDIRGYEGMYDSAYQLLQQKKFNDSVAIVNQKKQTELVYQNLEREKKQREIDNQIAWHKKDSIEKAEKLMRDSIARIDRRINDLKYKNECIKKFGTEKGTRIARGIIKIGDTKDMCEYAWGMADDVSFSTSKNETIEMWFYWDSFTYLSFKNKILVRITQ